VVVVEDHYPAGGIGEAVLSIIYHLSSINFAHLCVRKLPRSGLPEELLAYEEINAEAIVKAVKTFI
jgi:transketolase